MQIKQLLVARHSGLLLTYTPEHNTERVGVYARPVVVARYLMPMKGYLLFSVCYGRHLECLYTVANKTLNDNTYTTVKRTI